MQTTTTPRGPQTEAAPVHIRWMIRRDMPEVLQIEQESFEFPWTEEDFLRCLRQRNCIGMVAEQRREGRRLHDLRAAQDQAAHPELRRPSAATAASGVGQQMVAKLISKLSSHRRTRDHAGSARDQPGGPALLPQPGLPGRPRAAQLLRGQRRRRLPDAVPAARRNAATNGEQSRSTASPSTRTRARDRNQAEVSLTPARHETRI